jgi:uncharacterized protein (UPF0248 family)
MEEIMDKIFWTPNDESDKKARRYLEKINHAPYATIALALLSLLVVFSGLILIGSF